MLRIPRLLALLLLISVVRPVLAFEAMPARPLTDPTFDRAVGQGPLIASNGNGYLAAWSGTSAVFALPISPAGESLRDKAVGIDLHVPDYVSVLDLVSDGTNYLLVISTASEVRTVVLDGNANVVSTAVVMAIPSRYVSAALAWNGRRHLLVYFDESASFMSLPGGTPLNAVFLDRDGRPAATPFVVMPVARFARAAVASNGRDFVVAAEYTLTCFGNGACDSVATVAVRDDASVGTPNVIVDWALIGHRALAWTRQTYVLVYTSFIVGTAGANEVPLNTAGQPARGATGMAVGQVRAESVAGTQSGAVVLVTSGNEARAMRFDVRGEPVDAQPLPVFNWPSTVTNLAFDSAASGNAVFAVWTRAETGENRTFIYGDVVDAAGRAGRSLAMGADPETLLAAGGSDRTQLVLYIVKRPSQQPKLFARRYVDGVAIEPPRELSGTPPTATIAAHGGDFLAITPGPVRARLFRSGSGMTADVELYAGGGLYERQDNPSAVWTGSDYLVGWTRTFPRGNGSGVYQRLMACRMSADGTLLTQPREVNTGSVVNAANAVVLQTRGGLVAVFNQTTPVYSGFPTPGLRHDLWAVHVSNDGDFIDAPRQLAVSPGSTEITGAAADATGNVFITWSDANVVSGNYIPPNSHAEIIAPDLSVTGHIDFADTPPHDVTWSGRSFLVAWDGNIQSYSPGGHPLSDPIHVATGGAPVTGTRIAPRSGGAFLAYAAARPEDGGSDLPLLSGSVIVDAGRSRAVQSR